MATFSENMTLDAYGFGYSFKTFLPEIRITAVKLVISSLIHDKIPKTNAKADSSYGRIEPSPNKVNHSQDKCCYI
jgi:hypothetical protein